MLAVSADFCVASYRNASLSRRGRLFFLALTGGMLASIGTSFVVMGFWPIFPMAGLEWIGLFAAFRYIARHDGDYERITMAGDAVDVETRHGAHVGRARFNRYWVQVVVRRRANGEPFCVALRSHGRELEIGHFMQDEDLLALAEALKIGLRCH